MLCRILRSNPHRGGVASRPGVDENDLEAREAEEQEVPETSREKKDGRDEESAAPGA